MQINRITNNINFGYNRDLNEKVNRGLAKSSNYEAQFILQLNKLVNSAEERTRYLESTEKDYKVVQNSAYFLTNLKPFVAHLIDVVYPDANYSEVELRDYSMELSNRSLKNSGHWLDNLCTSLKQNIINNELSKIGISAAKIAETADKNPSETAKEEKTQAESKENETKTASANSEIIEEFVPNDYSPKGLKSLGGMEEVKEMLKDKIIYPAMNPKAALLDEIEYGIKSPRGELLYGPPGCGKTSVIEAIAAETGFPLFKLKVGKAGSKYVNETAKNVQRAYDYAVARAEKCGTPVFLAIDEMESMTSRRRGSGSGEDDKVVSTLLQIIEEARSKNVIILGATNCFNLIDDAIKSRFDDKIYVGLPDDDTRRQVLKIHLNKRTKGVDLANDDDELDKVVKLTKGFSNRDIAILTDKAALIARKNGRRDIEAKDFEVPIKENQNMKINESLYQDKTKQSHIGFN